MRTLSFILLHVVVFACAQMGIAQEGEKEPVYQGKPLKDWIQALQAPDQTLRLKAVGAWGAWGPRAAPAVRGFVRSWEEKAPFVRTMVFMPLSGIGNPAVPALLEMFKDQGRDQETRR